MTGPSPLTITQRLAIASTSRADHFLVTLSRIFAALIVPMHSSFIRSASL
jgi:hypothetical protein